jgi:inward rectifier potassium channel
MDGVEKIAEHGLLRSAAWSRFRQHFGESEQVTSMDESSLPMTNSAAANYDPGLTQKYTGALNRVVNKNGEFNVQRAGTTWRDAHPYTFLISTKWWEFAAIVTVTFIIVNLLFAWVYMFAADGKIKGAESKDAVLHFWNLFFFSAHTLTTVGYGNMYPEGPLANAIASLEALLGLMAFAIATGLFFGRFARPSARFGFSPVMVIAPYGDGTSLQFRVVNRRTNSLIEVEARVMLMTVEFSNGRAQRKYRQLDLERTQVLFLPLTWTVVHPIVESSPLYRKTAEDLERLQAEVVVLMRGFDETFGQVVHARYSYRYDEIMWGAKFAAAFDVDAQGELLLWVDKVGLTEPAPFPE